MGYSLCIVAIFGHFQNALIFRILAVFLEPNVFVEIFFACLRQFYFLTQVSILHGLSLCNSNVFVERFFACFRQFYFLTQSEYFAWAIAFALWPFLAIFKMLSFFEFYLFFESRFLHRTTLMCL